VETSHMMVRSEFGKEYFSSLKEWLGASWVRKSQLFWEVANLWKSSIPEDVSKLIEFNSTRERASATRFLLPWICWMLLVNCAIKSRCLSWRGEYLSDLVCSEKVNGLWSVYTEKGRRSTKWRKCLIAQYTEAVLDQMYYTFFQLVRVYVNNKKLVAIADW
jgi:hypothetical protein